MKTQTTFLNVIFMIYRYFFIQQALVFYLYPLGYSSFKITPEHETILAINHPQLLSCYYCRICIRHSLCFKKLALFSAFRNCITCSILLISGFGIDR